MPRGIPHRSLEDDEYDPATNISDAEDFEKSSKGVRKISDPRQLKRWGVDDDQYLLIFVAEYAKSKGFRIPWDQVGAQFEPVKTEAAIKQHIDKTRISRIEAQLPVPIINETAAPSLAQGRVLASPSITSNKRKDRRIAPAVKGKGHKSLLPPPEPVKPGRINGKNWRNQTGKITKAIRGKKIMIKKEEIEDNDDDCLIVERPPRAILNCQPESSRVSRERQQYEPFRLRDEQLQSSRTPHDQLLQPSQCARDEHPQWSQMSQERHLPPVPAGAMTFDVGDGTSAVLENADQLSPEFKAWLVLPVEQKKQSSWFRMFKLDGSPRWDETARSFFGSKEWHLWKQRKYDSFLHVTVANMPRETDFLGGKHEFCVNDNFLEASTRLEQQRVQIQEVADRHGLPVEHESIRLGAKRAGLCFNPNDAQDVFPMGQEQYARVYSQGWKQNAPFSQMGNRSDTSNLTTRAELSRSDSTYFSDMNSTTAGSFRNMQPNKLIATNTMQSDVVAFNSMDVVPSHNTSSTHAIQGCSSDSGYGTQSSFQGPVSGCSDEDATSLPCLDTAYNSLNSSELSSSVEQPLSATNALDGPVFSQDTKFGGFIGFSTVGRTHCKTDKTFPDDVSVAFTLQSPTLEAFNNVDEHNLYHNMTPRCLGSSFHGLLDDSHPEDIETLGKAAVSD